jgi:hypothetical protein
MPGPLDGQPDRASVELAIASEQYGREVLGATRREMARREIVQIEADSLKVATTACLVAEMEFFDDGMRMAQGSEVKTVLLARKLEVLSRRNDRLLTRAFGG